jgi:hypothetical protein
MDSIVNPNSSKNERAAALEPTLVSPEPSCLNELFALIHVEVSEFGRAVHLVYGLNTLQRPAQPDATSHC